MFVVLVVYVVWQTYPNYDTYYTLVWGKELANGHLPDYDVFRTPTPHPLSTLVAWVMAPFGTASDRILVLLSLFGLLGFYVVTFVFTERLLGRVIALLAVAVMVTRTDMQLLALRAMFDLPFYLMIFGAALLELRRPRCGWPVLLAARARRAAAARGVAARRRLLALPRPGHPAAAADPLRAARRRRAGALAARRPDRHRRAALLAHLDARGVGRVRPQPRRCGDAIRSIPNYLGGNDRIVTVGVGGLGLLARGLHPAPPGALPLALGGLGLLTFLIIAAGGLSVIPRYLTIPSLLLSALRRGRARRLAARSQEPTARKVAIGIAIFSALVLAWRAPYYVRDYQKLADQATFIEAQHKGLKGILDAPNAVAGAAGAAVRSPSRRTRRSRSSATRPGCRRRPSRRRSASAGGPRRACC